MEGLAGCKQAHCKFAHIDVSDLPGDSKLKLASLTKALRDTTLGQKIAYTEAGKHATA
jgi:hypothetical protein